MTAALAPDIGALRLTRHPVFDASERLFAYDVIADHTPDELSDLLSAVPLGDVAEDIPILVAASAGLLRNHALLPKPARRLILELPAGDVAARDVRDICTALRGLGYGVAVQIGATRAHEALETIALLGSSVDIAKIDTAAFTRAELPVVAEAARRSGARLLATNVRNSAERDFCRVHGFDLFEGHRFALPESFPAKPPLAFDRLRAFRLLQVVRDPNTSDETIELHLRRDVGLTHRLLRMVNSAAIGGHEIESIGHALRIVGRDMLARSLSALFVRSFVETPVRAEVACLSLTRANMCERLADEIRMREKRGTLFLVGLVSVFDQLLEARMETLCASLNLAVELRSALIYHAGIAGDVLRLVECCTSGEWTAAEQAAKTVGVDPHVLPGLYVDALSWAARRPFE